MASLKDIRAFVFDVDGVLTDGGIYAVDGDLLRRYDAKDCFATRMASMHGYCLGIITGGISKTIPQRFLRCGFAEEDIYLGSRDKMEQMKDFCNRHDLTLKQVMFCGDDLPDLPLIKACGIGACPADAVEQLKEAADFVSEFGGGHGFARNVIETVMNSQGKWVLDVDVYKTKF